MELALANKGRGLQSYASLIRRNADRISVISSPEQDPQVAIHRKHMQEEPSDIMSHRVVSKDIKAHIWSRDLQSDKKELCRSALLHD